MGSMSCCARNSGLIGGMIIGSLLIGLLCMTAGYLVNKNYNAQYRPTTCTFMSYTFDPFPYNNWNCRGCTAYHAWINTKTADGREWFTYQANVYPPGNSVDRQRNWYQQHWPIGATVPCYQTACCMNPPIFELADVDGTFWSGIAFLSIGGAILAVTVIYLIVSSWCHRGYTELKDEKSNSDPPLT